MWKFKTQYFLLFLAEGYVGNWKREQTSRINIMKTERAKVKILSVSEERPSNMDITLESFL